VREELRQRTSVDIRDEGVIVIAVQDSSPERATALIDAYIHCIDSLLIEFTIEHASGRKQYLELEVARRKRRITAADSALRAFLDEHGVFEIEQQTRAAIEVAARLEARMRLVWLEKEMLGMTLRPGSPELERAKRMLEKLEDEITAVHEGGHTELFPPLSEIPDLASEYLRLFGELKVQEFALAYIRLKLEDEVILVNRDVSVIRIIDPPFVPQRRAWPKRSQIVLVSTLAIFFWVCFGLIVVERWSDGLLAFESPGTGKGSSPGERGGGDEG
jgi:tyrosine-protein kinase Etk/Wzc